MKDPCWIWKISGTDYQRFSLGLLNYVFVDDYYYFIIGICICCTQKTYKLDSGSFRCILFVVVVSSDGKLDIIVTNSVSDNVTIIYSSGKGNFKVQVAPVTEDGASLYAVTVADGDCDGKPNIMTVKSGADTIGIFIDRSASTFNTQVIYSNSIDVLINRDIGIFSNQVAYSVRNGSSPISVTTGDVNRDCTFDIIVSNIAVGSGSVLLNFSDATYLR